jgi:hypothetical protein
MKMLSEMAKKEKESQEKLLDVVSKVAGQKISNELDADKYLQEFAKKAALR